MTSTSVTTRVLPGMGGRGARGGPRRPARRGRIGRVVSLDAARGLLVLVTVAWLAAPSRPFPASEPWGAVGLDAVALPAFALIAGCAHALAQHRGWTSAGRATRRTLILLLLGLVVAAGAALIRGAATGIPLDPEGGSLGGLERIAVAGPLVQLAVALAALGLLGTLARSWAGWAWATVISTAVGAGALWLTTGLCGELSDRCSPATLLVGGIADAAGTTADPLVVQAVTTVVAGLGLAVPAAAGAALAHALLRARSVPGHQRGRVVGYGLLAATLFGVLGILAYFTPTVWGQQPLEPATALWTPPLTLAVASLASVLACAMHPTVDTDLRGGTSALGAFAEPFAAVGRISMLAVTTTFAARTLLSALPDPDPVGWFAALGDIPSVVLALVVAAAWLGLALWADRSGRRLRP
ncbi:hypothetical protein [Agrococcus sp. SCSIO52902]|uniref:hypothetical protein n=1 Tax=Agrococcus sp. SCSIO52902 TaxID=2933290 RepID=UPI001FF2A44C|nr:hypothetical protein [Agrococcus sp. SCSIO52902]UOW02022.1 hypothetical protein MU522_06405 [Agrococcus sp. SCSIO52902]